MSVITSVEGRLVFNSRGSKTVEIDVITDNKFIGRASSPTGASVGSYEVVSFAKNSPELSLELFNSYSRKFIGLDVKDPKTIFDALKSIDNTETYQ